jgi:hypothetical protein
LMIKLKLNVIRFAFARAVKAIRLQAQQATDILLLIVDLPAPAGPSIATFIKITIAFQATNSLLKIT